MAHTYAHLYGLPATGLRFFTVYGPWGRPDMALFLFTKAILEGQPIDVFNRRPDAARLHLCRRHRRGRASALIDRPPQRRPGLVGRAPDPAPAPRRTALQHRQPHPGRAAATSSRCIEERARQARADKRPAADAARRRAARPTPMSPTCMARVDFRPATPIEDGIARFVAWYREFYGVGRQPTP